MVKKGLIFLLVGMLLVLSACGSSGKNAQSNSASSSEVSRPDSSGTGQEQEAPDPFGKYDKTVTINIGRSIDPTEKLPDGDTPENNQYSRYIKDNLNIDVKVVWQAASGKDYDQKVNLSIASNDLPDGMVVNDTQLRQMVRADQLEDLTNAYKQYASPVMKSMMDKTEGRAVKAVTFGGKMVAIPSLQVPEDGYHLMWIRKDWLDKLNLQVPKTIDDLEKVAKAFVEQDPDGNGKADTIGISGPQNGGSLYATFLASTNNTFGFDPIFSSYHAFPGYWLQGSDGKIVYGSILPETKTALAKLSEMYAKGLIDKEMGVRKDASEPVVSGKSGIYFGPWWGGYWPLPDAIKNNPKANWQAYALPLDINGQVTAHVGTVSTQFTVIRKGYEHPEAAVKMANLLIRDESTFDLDKGGIGNYPLRVPQASPDECQVTVQSLKDVLVGTKKPEDFNDESYKIYKLLKGDVANIKKVKLEPYDKMDIQYWNPQADMGAFNRLYSLMVGSSPIYAQPVNKIYSITYSQTKTMESKWANLKKLEDETFLKIIMGAATVDSFDQFVKDWKAQGGDQITAEVEEASKQ